MRKERILILRTGHYDRMIGLDVRQTYSMPPAMGRQIMKNAKFMINRSSPTLLVQQMIHLPLV